MQSECKFTNGVKEGNVTLGSTLQLFFLELSEKCQTRLGSFPSQVIFYLQKRHSRRSIIVAFKYSKMLFNHKFVNHGKHYSHVIKYLQCSSFELLHRKASLSKKTEDAFPLIRINDILEMFGSLYNTAVH